MDPQPQTHYMIGRVAVKTKHTIQELLQEMPVDISRPDVPKGVLTRTTAATACENAPPAKGSVINPTTKQYDGFESRTLLLKDILEYLVDANIKIVGVYGPVGGGKTSLMKQVINRVKAEKLFDKVAMANVSANPDTRRIQGEISDMLDLKLTDETIQGRAFHLKRMLESTKMRRRIETTRTRRLENTQMRSLENSQKKKVLVILNDLWEELRKGGNPSQQQWSQVTDHVKQRRCAICKSGFADKLSGEALTYDEKWKLFRKMVGNIADDPTFC
ncbi:hypothetical protein CDL15_Pgr027526 [Punica granatum]|uniref:NB-ARC domain-containing protein n=1 Tax=Punica granatum TaxID=22663 RepID=A0A218XJ75_PUNGR|nr:hypothetical protein CDL15_Pgr027526 [Punica granatum]